MGKMNFIRNSNKRMRLDEGNIGNDDLWGQEDITADEFDMLEFQATQSMPGTSVTNVPLQVDSSEQKQYELEGKIRILSDSIETAKKELNEEKLKRDKIIAEKTHDFEEKEKLLQKQIESLRSSLQFKDQEMKAVHDKVKTLEIQLKENKVNAKASTSKSPNKYLAKFDFKADSPVRHSESTFLRPKRLNCKFTLPVDTPKGETPGCDIISSILCNRLFPPQIPFHSTLPNQLDSEHSANRFLLSPVSVTKLSLEQKSDEILQYYTSILENYISNLQSLSDQANSNSCVMAKKKDFDCERAVVISCLKDLNNIISCFQLSDSLFEESLVQEAKKALQNKDSSGSSSASFSSNYDQKHRQPERKMHTLLTLLFLLSRPDTYPKGYACREEVEWSLSALISWSASNPKSFAAAFDDRVITSHISNCFCIATTNITLRLLLNICTFEEYLSRCIHNNDTCHLCSIATLLNRTISNSPLECIDLTIMVEDFLSSVFSVHSFSDMKLESTPCSMMVLQAVLSTLMKFSNIQKKGHHNLNLLLKKGFTLLHYLSKYIPNFKIRRVDFEDLYISTVCVMLSLSKDPLFKDFQEIAQELWDFQEDTSEVDTEDLSDDSTPTINLKSQNDT